MRNRRRRDGLREGRIGGVRVGSFVAVKGRKEELANVKWGREEGRGGRGEIKKGERDHRGSHVALGKSVFVSDVEVLSLTQEDTSASLHGAKSAKYVAVSLTFYGSGYR